MKLNLERGPVLVSFKHVKPGIEKGTRRFGVTTAFLKVGDQDYQHELVTFAKDSYNPLLGRKLALKRVLEKAFPGSGNGNEDREIRKIIYQKLKERGFHLVCERNRLRERLEKRIRNLQAQLDATGSVDTVEVGDFKVSEVK